MIKKLLVVPLSIVMIGGLLVGCSDSNKPVEKDELDKKNELVSDEKVEKVTFNKNSDGLYEVKMFNVFGGMLGEDGENFIVDGNYITFLLNDEEFAKSKKEYAGKTAEILEELENKDDDGSPIVSFSFDSKTVTMNLEIDTSISNWETGIGMFMWLFNTIAVPEYAFEGIVTDLGVNYVLKDSKTGEILDFDGSFNFNEEIDLSDIDLSKVEVGDGVTLIPMETENGN